MAATMSWWPLHLTEIHGPQARPSVWGKPTKVNQTSSNAPSLAAFQPYGETGQLFVVFVGASSQQVFVCSFNGTDWSLHSETKQSCAYSPSLAAFEHNLYLAFTASDGSNGLLICSSPQGTDWSAKTSVNQSSFSAPSLAEFKLSLRAGFISSTQQLWLTSSMDMDFAPKIEQVFGPFSGLVRAVHAHNALVCFRDKPFTLGEFEASVRSVGRGENS